MKIKIKKHISKVIILVTLLMMFYTVPVSASNYKDTVFDFYFKTAAGGTTTTELREKQDDSSAYMKCEKTVFPYTALVLGTQSVYDEYYDVSKGHHYTFDSGTVYKMINYVYENNFKYAVIHAKRVYSYNYAANGLWSPDSV
ncbi:MAG: hypothetical protein HFH65_09495 [Lachnospiraceae bacterium]|nr:hypothetical protein [Lachnospiraceae bacterium]MCI8825254.1 hypothetical protein [Lachnospiraceae bacterium]MCI9370534.1 hypothetical protein [Lachnospiraceae bacterium]